MLSKTAVLDGAVIVISYAVEIIRTIPLCGMVAEGSVRIEIRKLLGDLLCYVWCTVALLAAGHRIDLI